jgi:hypothetical protein
VFAIGDSMTAELIRSEVPLVNGPFLEVSVKWPGRSRRAESRVAASTLGRVRLIFTHYIDRICTPPCVRPSCQARFTSKFSGMVRKVDKSSIHALSVVGRQWNKQRRRGSPG